MHIYLVVQAAADHALMHILVDQLPIPESADWKLYDLRRKLIDTLLNSSLRAFRWIADMIFFQEGFFYHCHEAIQLLGVVEFV
jgi:hypothetical protein